MTGIERIAAERKRHVEKEGWTPEHDTLHNQGELAVVAACYAVNKLPGYGVHFYGDMNGWPITWSGEWDKRAKHDRLRSLEIAGSLIAAEIDRLIAEGGGAA